MNIDWHLIPRRLGLPLGAKVDSEMRGLAFDRHVAVQSIAKRALEELLGIVQPGVTEQLIATAAEDLMRRLGIEQFWYHGIAALVLVGERTTLSVSGRDYAPTSKAVHADDLITIDLSPAVGRVWGDYARSIFVEDGVASLEPSPSNVALRHGYEMENLLHAKLIELANPKMTAHELWSQMNALIKAKGFENLDFQGNLGHSIEQNLGDRAYIECGNQKRLSDLSLFTFEPHIRRKGGNLGYKHEDIFCFCNGALEAI